MGNLNPVTLASEFFENNNFLNYYAFANAVYDTYNPTLSSNGQPSSGGGVGYSIGGGLSARHLWRRSVLNLSYSGDYRNYSSSFFGSGTDQSLNLTYSRRLGRHWNLGVGGNAGTVLFGTGYFGQQLTGNNVQLNPYSNSTRFVSTSVSLSYQQTRRLSYNVAGSFYLQRYSYPFAVGATGGNGDIGVNYRVTARDTVSADYAHSHFVFQRNAGTSDVDSYYFSYSHRFVNHWTVAGSGGVARSHVTGTAQVPVNGVNLTGQVINGFLIGAYDTVTYLPSFSGTVTHFLKHSSFSASGGQNVVSGNGYYLASKSQFFSGIYSRSFRKSNASLGGNWNRLNSVANSVSYSYISSGISASYGVSLIEHVSANARYDYVRYGTLPGNPGVSDNRFTVGIAFSSQSVPLTLY